MSDPPPPLRLSVSRELLRASAETGPFEQPASTLSDPPSFICTIAFGLAIPVAAVGLLVSACLLLVPVLGVLLLPTASACALALCYSITGLAYAQLAQVDPPPSARKPFFRLSLSRNLTLGIRLIRWTVDCVSLAARLGVQWCIREVIISRSKEEIVIGPIAYAAGHLLTIFRPPCGGQNQATPSDDHEDGEAIASPLRPIIVLLPPPSVPMPARAKDVLLSLAAHQLRLAPAVVVVPSAQAFPAYPAAQLEHSVAHTRDYLLPWIAANARSFGGDPDRVFFAGHGAAGVVAIWAGGLRDAIVGSRKAFLWQRWERKRNLSDGARWDLDSDDADSSDDQKVRESSPPDLNELDGDGVDEVTNGLKMVEIWGNADLPPHVEGVILLSAPANIPLQIREEAALYVEHLSYTRRYFGPSHVQCMLASPSQCLYAAKSVLNLRHPQMIRRWLLVHGGKDILVPPTQAAMMQELLLGLGFSDVHLRAYRDMGHFDSIVALARGANSHYCGLILRDIRAFLYPADS